MWQHTQLSHEDVERILTFEKRNIYKINEESPKSINKKDIKNDTLHKDQKGEVENVFKIAQMAKSGKK